MAKYSKIKGLPKDGRTRALLRQYAHSHNISQKEAIRTKQFQEIRKGLREVSEPVMPKRPKKTGKLSPKQLALWQQERRKYRKDLKAVGTYKMQLLERAGYRIVNPWEAYVDET